MSVLSETKKLQQAARDLERATLVQICHLVRSVVPGAKTFLVVLEVRDHSELSAAIEVPSYSEGAAYEWDDKLNDEDRDALRDLETLISGAPKFSEAIERNVTIAKLIGENESPAADEVDTDVEDEEPEVEVESIRQVGEGWEVDLGTADFRGVLSALPLEDGEFFIEISAASTGADITSIDATGEPGTKVRVKVSTNRRTTTLSADAQTYVEDLLDKAKDVDALRPSIEAMGQVLVTVS